MLAGEALERLGWLRAARVVAVGVIAGVPAVAVGITATHLGWASEVEPVAALVMAASGVAVGGVHIALGLRPGDGAVAMRCLWVVAGCSLIAGMLLGAAKN